MVLLIISFQAPQIASAYLDDSEAVAAAKEIFSAAFAEAESGGLAAKQQPAPEHVVQEVNITVEISKRNVVFNNFYKAKNYKKGYDTH